MFVKNLSATRKSESWHSCSHHCIVCCLYCDFLGTYLCAVFQNIWWGTMSAPILWIARRRMHVLWSKHFFVTAQARNLWLHLYLPDKLKNWWYVLLVLWRKIWYCSWMYVVWSRHGGSKWIVLSYTGNLFTQCSRKYWWRVYLHIRVHSIVWRVLLSKNPYQQRRKM